MKAKQFIYTSWKNGNSPSKGFMVYSMSTGISQEDSNAIQVALKYLPPTGLPYAPTPEQVENMFPRGCAYFKLPSGKYCLGQSMYIGKDYSGRQGNYIIHAFVFEEKPDLNAFEFINSKFFKRSLTDEEANADSNPPPLPEIEVSQQHCAIDDCALVKFFTPEKLQLLKYLISAVLQADKAHKCVYLYDDYDALPYWFRAVQMCLPQDFIKDVTFTTYAINKSPSIVLQSLKPGGVVNYRMMLQLGEFVYNVKENIINNKVAVGKFVSDVVDEFAKSVDAAKTKVRAIEAYLAQAGNDPDFALTVAQFYSLNYKAFSSTEELMAIVRKLQDSGSYNADKTVKTLVAFDKAFNFNVFENDEFFRFIYENDEISRNAIIAKYLKAIEQYGEADGNIYSACYNELISKAPFPVADLCGYISANNGMLSAYVQRISNNEFLQYYVIRLFIESGILQDVSAVKMYFNKQIAKKQLKIIRELNALLKQNMQTQSLLDDSILSMLSSSMLNLGDVDFILALSDEVTLNTCSELIIALIKRNSGNMFAGKMVAYLKKRGLDINSLASLSGNDATVIKFIDDVRIMDFSKGSHTEEELKKFYNDIYSKGKDSCGTFIQALEDYINGLAINYEKLLEATLAWAEFFKTNGLNPQDKAKANRIIIKTFDGVKSAELYAVFNGRNARLVNKVDAWMESLNEYPPAYAAVKLGSLLERAVKRRFESAILQGIFDDIENDTLLTKDVAADAFIAKKFISEIFELYEKVKTKRPDIMDDMIDNVLVPLQECSKGAFAEAIAIKFAKVNFKEADDYILPLVNRADSGEVYEILVAYFIKLGGGKTRKLIKTLTKGNQLNRKGDACLERFMTTKIWKS